MSVNRLTETQNEVFKSAREYVNINPPIVAVQINVETEGLHYSKWGSNQIAKQGDWIVNNGGECYTIDNSSFRNTYTQVSEGMYKKTATVWAVQMPFPGEVKTKEGVSTYAKGDWLTANEADGNDAYRLTAEKFPLNYQLK